MALNFRRAFGNAATALAGGLSAHLRDQAAREQGQIDTGTEQLGLIDQQIAQFATPQEFAVANASIDELMGPAGQPMLAALQSGVDLSELIEGGDFNRAQRMNLERGVAARGRLRDTAEGRGIRTDVNEFMRETAGLSRRAAEDAAMQEGMDLGLSAEEASIRARQLLGAPENEMVGHVDPETGEVIDRLTSQFQPIQDQREAAAKQASLDFRLKHMNEIGDDVRADSRIRDLDVRILSAQQVLAFLKNPGGLGSAGVIQSFQRLIDPDSVVRSSEIDFIRENFGDLDKLKVAFQRVVEGGAVNNPVILQQFERMTRQIMAFAAERALPVVSGYRQRANIAGIGTDGILSSNMTNPSMMRDLILGTGAPGENGLNFEQLSPQLRDAFEQFDIVLLPSAVFSPDGTGTPAASGIQIKPGGGG